MAAPLPTAHLDGRLLPLSDAKLSPLDRGFLFGDGVSLAFWLNGTTSAGCCRFVGGPYLETRFFGEGTAMALRPDAETLKKAIDFALFRLWESGVYADLLRRWFPVSPYAQSP